MRIAALVPFCGLVSEVGTFAVAPVEKEDYLVIVRQGPVCGILGTVPLLGLLLVMSFWTTVRHKRRLPFDPLGVFA